MKRSAFWDLEAVISHDLFETISIGMIVMSEMGHYLVVNPAFCRMLGYSKKELTGRSFRDVTHPDDWKISPKNPRQLQLGKPSTWSYEKRYIHKSGRVVWGRVNVFLTRAGQSKTRKIFAQVVDITARKIAEEKLRESNERFRVALAQSPVTVFSQDRELRYTWIYNSRMPLKVEEILGKRDSDLLTAADAECRMRVKKAVLKTGVGRRDEVVAHLNDRAVIHDLRAEPLRDGNGKIIGIIGVSTDITQRKQLEEALRQANEQLERKVKERTVRLSELARELVRSEHRERCRIAHILHEDLQQELVATKFLCAELKEKSSTPLKASLADRTLNQLDHAIDITRTLSVDLRPHVLNHMSMGKCIEWLAADVKKRLGLNVRVRVGKAPDIGSDEMRIFAYEAARELLLNVIKHAKVKSAEVLFSSMGADRVKLQIRDKGVGFAPEHNQVANRHFGHFSIQERAELLGGLFEVRSQPGKGTCATLILPSGRCSSLSGDVQPG